MAAAGSTPCPTQRQGGVTVNLQTNSASGGDAQGDTISNFEAVEGSNAGDRLTSVEGTIGDAAFSQLYMGWTATTL